MEWDANLLQARTFWNTILVSVNRRRRHIVERKGEDEYVVTGDITIHAAARPVASLLKAVDPFPIPDSDPSLTKRTYAQQSSNLFGNG